MTLPDTLTGIREEAAQLGPDEPVSWIWPTPAEALAFCDAVEKLEADRVVIGQSKIEELRVENERLASQLAAAQKERDEARSAMLAAALSLHDYEISYGGGGGTSEAWALADHCGYPEDYDRSDDDLREWLEEQIAAMQAAQVEPSDEARKTEEVTKEIEDRDAVIEAHDALVTLIGCETEYSNNRGYAEIYEDCEYEMSQIGEILDDAEKALPVLATVLSAANLSGPNIATKMLSKIRARKERIAARFPISVGDKVRCGSLGCLTDDCEHWGKGCNPVDATPCLINLTVQPPAASEPSGNPGETT